MESDTAEVAELNKRYWDLPEVAQHYAQARGPLPGESVLLSHFDADVSGRRVLDIAVGAGRTTELLLPLAGTYVGIDYSEEMLKHCRARFPEADLRLCDARALRAFDDGAFDLVLISYNAIDDIAPAERARVLREIVRILAGGGLLLFSSHNLAAAARSRFVQRVPETSAQGFAIVDELNAGHRLPTCYITREAQLAELEALGLGDLQVADQAGRFLDRGAPCDDGWIYYVARKAR